MTLKFMPDSDPTVPELALDLTNMFPTHRGYKGAPSAVDAGYAALAAECNGAALVTKLDGSTRLFAGTTSAIYEGSGGTWTDRSAGGGYSTGDTSWGFAQFGDTTIAVNKSVTMQTSTSGAFSAATAPKATCVETVFGFVMLADVDDTGAGIGTSYGNVPDGWWCSPQFSATGSWTPSVTTLANRGQLVDTPGAIKALKRLGRDIVAYKERSLYLARFVGPNEVWRFDLIPGEIGTPSPDSVVSIGYAQLFIGYEDIYMFDGSRPVSIGVGVKEWLFARLNRAYRYKIRGLHDYLNGLVLWWYPSGSDDTLNSVLAYHYLTGRWGAATITAEVPVQIITGATTYDSLGTSYATYDDLPAVTYDSPFWSASAPLPAYLDGTHTVQLLTGVSSSSSLTTGMFGDPERWSLLTRVRPHYKPGKKPATVTLTPSWSDTLGDTMTTGSTLSDNNDRFDVRQSGRWHKLQFDYTGDVELIGYTPQTAQEGEE